MTDLIVFSIGTNRYALNIDNIQRIVQSIELTDIPNANEYIDGMMSYEGNVIKVLSFRKLIGLKTYQDELHDMFLKLKIAHQNWIDELKDSIENGSPFKKILNPHKCELGIWLDNFNSYDDSVSNIFNNLMVNHKHLHAIGSDALEIYKTDKKGAIEMFHTTIYDIFNTTMNDLGLFINKLDKVANSLQKLLIYESSDKIFAIKVDTIEDIAHIEEKKIMISDKEYQDTQYLELDGVLDLNGVLINVINTVILPN